jgi:hypothetical protein
METTPDHPRLLHRLSLAQVRIALIIICFSLLFGCVQSGSVPMGNRYAAVNPQSVQILFQPPPWRYEQIGIVTCLGAQAASDASVYRELQRQAAGLAADAVLVISSQPAIQGGFATYDAWTGYGFAAGPSVIGLKLSGIALKRIKG